MKKILLLIGFLYSLCAIGQVIDFNRFDEITMNEVLFQRMKELSENHNYYLAHTTKGQRVTYRFIKRNNEKMSIDELNIRLNKILGRCYESREMKKSNMVGCVGLIDKVSSTKITTYQDVASRCVEDWTNSENNFFLNWSKTASTVSFFNSSTQTIILVLGYFE